MAHDTQAMIYYQHHRVLVNVQKRVPMNDCTTKRHPILYLMLHLGQFFVELLAQHPVWPIVVASLTLTGTDRRHAAVRQKYLRRNFQREINGRPVGIVPSRPVDTNQLVSRYLQIKKKGEKFEKFVDQMDITKIVF